MTYFVKRPVAFRVIAGDSAAVFFDDEGVASRYSESLGLDYQGLYVRDGTEIVMNLTEDQIKHMVNRFLGWRLPKNFSPDGGISATRPNYGPNVEWTPSGTNLLDATQADAMVRYMIEGMSPNPDE